MRLAYLSLFLFTCAACSSSGSGTGDPDGGGATGGTSTGGTGGGTGGSGTGGTGGNPKCPPASPAHDDQCADEGLSCSYGECCPTFAQCSGGKWQLANAPCAAPACPDTPPKNGESCKCMGGLDCQWLDCNVSGDVLSAYCDGDMWSVSSDACPPQIDAGPPPD